MNPKRTSVVVNKEYFPDSNTGKYKLHVISALQQNWESPLDSYAHKKKMR